MYRLWFIVCYFINLWGFSGRGLYLHCGRGGVAEVSPTRINPVGQPHNSSVCGGGAYLYLTLSDPVDPAQLLCQWDSPGKNTGGDCHFLLQGVLPTQGSNPGLLHWQVVLYH